MTDLLHVLPDLDTASYSHILPSLERALISSNDILTCHPVDIAKRATVPSAQVRRLREDLVTRLQSHIESSCTTGTSTRPWNTISTLDERVDDSLGGGFPAGYLSEITGESAAGKTQILLTLCLSVQLPPPHGLSRSALYITTEGPLQTTRLRQMMTSNPLLSSIPESDQPNLSRIHSIKIADLEAQEHILTYQVPVVVARHNIGLIVIDSIAANFRAEFERPSTDSNPTNASSKTKRNAFAERSAQLVRLGTHLRSLAQQYNLAIVVANQVLDRFSPADSLDAAAGGATARGGSDVRAGTWPGSQASQSSRSASQRILAPRALSGPGVPGRTISSSSATSAVKAKPSADGRGPARQTTPSCDQAEHEEEPALQLSTPDPLALDHQHRFTTGWGHLPPALSSVHPAAAAAASYRQHAAHLHRNAKTPSLGQVWTAQLAARVVVLRSPVYRDYDYRLGMGREKEVVAWRRWVNVAFAAWVGDGNGGLGTDVEIWEGGVRGMDEGGVGRGRHTREVEDGDSEVE